MDPSTYVDPQLTTADRLVIDAVIEDPAAKGTSLGDVYWVYYYHMQYTVLTGIRRK